jgi:anti-anti-sigma factor
MTPPIHLRLACYELVANTVEHADFDTSNPEIRIGIRFGHRGVRVSYRDNGAEFNTETLKNVDIGGKITRGERRGLGLFMLRQIAESFTYERSKGWNVTSLSITYEHPERESRRSDMSGINIITTPCSIEDTMIIRPVGTIDSTTSSMLEAQIAKLAEQEVRRIVVDMADVAFISSSGIGVFLGSVSDLRSRGGDLLFMNVPVHVDDVFEIVNLKTYFRVISGLEELQATS